MRLDTAFNRICALRVENTQFEQEYFMSIERQRNIHSPLEQ